MTAPAANALAIYKDAMREIALCSGPDTFDNCQACSDNLTRADTAYRSMTSPVRALAALVTNPDIPVMA